MHQTLSQALKLGALAGATTTAAVAALSRRDTGSAAAGINAVSHIAWGERAARQHAVSARYTLTGLALNLAAVAGWALLHETIFRGRRQSGLARPLAAGAATAALAYVVDYHVVPERFTPGFEKRLSRPALAAVYGVLAASLAASPLLRRR